MLKQTASIVMLLGLLVSPLAWSQDDLDGDDIEMQADQDDASGDEAVQEEEDAVADDAPDAGDAGELADESAGDSEVSEDEAADSEDAAADQMVDEPLADDDSGTDSADLDAADPVSETPSAPPAEPAQSPAVTPAPVSAPVASSPPPAAPPAAPSKCRCNNDGVGMRTPASRGLFGMRIPTGMGLFALRSPIGKGQCQSDRQSGVVKWFSDAKCFGFITPESGRDLFVHYCSIQGTVKSLEEGQAVTFKVAQTAKGLQAVEVQPQ